MSRLQTSHTNNVDPQIVGSPENEDPSKVPPNIVSPDIAGCPKP